MCILFYIVFIGVIWTQSNLSLFLKYWFSDFILFFRIFYICTIFTFLLFSPSPWSLTPPVSSYPTPSHRNLFFNLKFGNINKVFLIFAVSLFDCIYYNNVFFSCWAVFICLVIKKDLSYHFLQDMSNSERLRQIFLNLRTS